MNTQDNQSVESELAALNNQESGASSESLDSNHEQAEQESSPSISAEDFDAPKAKEAEVETIKSTESASNKISIEDKMYDKYVIQEDGTLDFDKLPQDLKWTAKGIKERYIQSEEKPELDINSLVDQGVNAQLAERDFKSQLQSLVEDTETTTEQKQAIKDKYLDLRAKGITDKLEALLIARQIAGVNVQPNKIVGVLPKTGNVPTSTVKTIDADALSRMNNVDYNATMEKVDKGELILNS